MSGTVYLVTNCYHTARFVLTGLANRKLSRPLNSPDLPMLPETLPRHEIMSGSRLDPDLAGLDVSVTPQVIRESLRLPKRLSTACLAPDQKLGYSPEFFDTADEYFRNWPRYRLKGMGALFVGPWSSDPSRAAAAAVNEIVTHNSMRGYAALSVSFLGCNNLLHTMLDARAYKSEMYLTTRDAMLRNHLIVVDDLLAAHRIEGGVALVHAIYSQREDSGLPTITTLKSAAPQGAFWGEVQAIYGRHFTERLRGMSKGLVAQHGVPLGSE